MNTLPQHQKIEPQSAERLIQALHTAIDAPDAIVNVKRRNNGGSRAVSVGKPWMPYENLTENYNNIFAERRRLRVVERWYDAQGDQIRGVIKAYMQYVFKTLDKHGQTTVDDVKGLYIGDPNRSELALLLDKPTDRFVAQDSSIKLSMLPNGSYYGKVLFRSAPRLEVSGTTDTADSLADDFANQQDRYEEEYRRASPFTVDVDHFTQEVTDFASEESILFKQRQRYNLARTVLSLDKILP